MRAELRFAILAGILTTGCATTEPPRHRDAPHHLAPLETHPEPGREPHLVKPPLTAPMQDVAPSLGKDETTTGTLGVGIPPEARGEDEVLNEPNDAARGATKSGDLGAEDSQGESPVPQKAPAAPVNQAHLDAEITRVIKGSIEGRDELREGARNVQVLTRRGIVTLRGVVDSFPIKERVDAIARTTPDVKDVQNEIEVVRP